MNGWKRFGITLSVIWVLSVVTQCGIELNQGPFSANWLTKTVDLATSESVAVSGDSISRHLIPVEQKIIPWRVGAALAVPPFILWSLGLTIAWIVQGFRRK